MWLRHALKLVVLVIIISACSSPDRQAVNKLNSLSYAYHYRNLDSTEYYARLALEAGLSDDTKAEALNHLAFVSISRMRYDDAARSLDSIPTLTDNQLELLVANVQQMRLCQRRSRNREFYDYREKALNALKRIDEERELLDDRQCMRLLYAETELAIVTSTYYYYVGLERQSIEALDAIKPNEVQRDTAQLLNYLYNVGAGGIITTGTQERINQQEFDCLVRCLLMAREYGSPYFEANALEALAEHLLNPVYRKQLLEDNYYTLSFINTDDVPETQLPAQMAEEALCLFLRYGDVYQTAGAYRTLAACSRAEGNYVSALYYLEQALSDTLINQAPDLVASIREQLSVAYSAIDDKASSDYNRNVYLDLQEQTRQDRSLEARAAQLDEAVAGLNKLLLAVGASILFLVLQIWGFVGWYRSKQQKKVVNEQDEQMEEVREQLAVSQMHIQNGERRHLEQRAKISLANSITPFIDRILYEVRRMDNGEADGQTLDYVRELIDKINEQNGLLTKWIQLRQGELSLHIETFSLQPLFDIVAKGRKSFQMQGVELTIHPSDVQVKADRVLTLFMLNTLADNARKFTAAGGHVEISAQETDEYVEISVADTGQGMDEEQLAHVFARKLISNDNTQNSHGFGLINCKGIIEKYRKTSRIFSVCELKAESKIGKGSRFFFRLPKGIVRLVLAFLFIPEALQAQNFELSLASTYADSAYYANIHGEYQKTLVYVDSCRMALNSYFLQQYAERSADTLQIMGNLSLTPPEVLWLHDSLQLNYSILLQMRNESAVAALALHKWDVYAYNNRIYTLLFKELSADNQLDEYCRRMQQSQTNRTIAIVLLVVILMAILLAVVAQMIHAVRKSAHRQQEQQANINLLTDELKRMEMEEGRLHVSNQVLDNCLSALKHETMYYPSRIRLLIESGDKASLAEVVSYYRELYAMLSQQAMGQMEGAKLHIKQLDHEILGDENLIGYLFEILGKQSGGKEKLQVDYIPKDERHMECRVCMPSLRLTDEEARMLFVPVGGQENHIPFLLCRQIVRDHGEATGRRGCGIWAEIIDHQTTIVIILPRQICRTSK